VSNDTVRSNRRPDTTWIIKKMVRTYYPPNRDLLEREDIEQVARLGILHADRKFDPAMDVKFETYAYKMAQVHVLKYLRDHHNCLVKIPAWLYEQNPRSNQCYELTWRAEADPRLATKQDFSDLDRDLTLLDALGSLSEKQQAVIVGMYGRDLSQKDIADEIDVTSNYVSHLHRRALDRLREILLDNGRSTVADYIMA
jgi:RNA polymerase sigma factor (sigma-70 family)